MSENLFLRVNEPNVVHETIDGETILLDLSTGNYFSFDGPGAIIWEFIYKTGEWKRVIDILTTEAQTMQEQFTVSVTSFVEALQEEKLLVPAENTRVPEDIEAIEAGLRKIAGNFSAPKLNKYSDMQDLLLLDPIHDVDEMGWPESPEIKD